MRVLIADDRLLIREGLRLILCENIGSVQTGEAAGARELLAKLHDEVWDVIVFDIGFPVHAGFDLLRQVRAMRPATPVLVLSTHADETYAVRALRSGATGCLTKESAPHELVTAIEKLARGGRYVPPAVVDALAAEITGDSAGEPHHGLSDRELDVLLLLAGGMTTTAIAAHLKLSPKTVSTYRRRILAKTGFDSNAQLIRYAIEHRLV
ncbi:MAG TPA: response regulator transcription factor [Thermoanaerobaculia bacterium]|nr:response regulator transcription factor [Thermoanaerobaculia bacterium]